MQTLPDQPAEVAVSLGVNLREAITVLERAAITLHDRGDHGDGDLCTERAEQLRYQLACVGLAVAS
jgi:hypothetical protein